MESSESESHLLASFNTDEEHTHIREDGDDANPSDSRLNKPAQPTSTSHEIDENIHQAIREGTSNENNEPTDETDLELQYTAPKLTPSQRIRNVLHHLIPIKQTYERINNGLTTGRMQSNMPGRFIGQGTDGVFRNLMAKPDTESNRIEQENNPPSYEEAAADATPEYWESTVVSPMYEDEVFVEGLPVGNIANFVWNGLVTVAFQFVGFVLCYLLHTSHAAKHGSRAGLGITFVIYGWGMVPTNFGNSNTIPDRYEPSDPNDFDINKGDSIKGSVDDYSAGITKTINATNESFLDSSKTPYIAYGLIAFGLFIILKSLVDYYRVKQMEKVILSPPQAVTTNSITEPANAPQD